MNRPDARAGLHGDHAFDRHRQVDQHAVTLLDAARFQAIGKTGNTTEQILVGDPRHLTIIRLENQRQLVAQAGGDMAVQAVVRDIQLAIGEPLVKRRVRFIQHLGERRLPAHMLPRQPRPITGIVLLGFTAQSLIGGHA